MAFPTNILSLADAIGSQFLSSFFGGSVSHSAGINQMKADLVAVETKLGTGSSTATANTVLRGNGTGTTAFGQIVSADITDGTIVDADINASAAIAVTKLAAGAANTMLIGGASNSFSASPTISGTFTATNVNAASAMQTGTTIKAGTKIYPGALNGTTGVQTSASLQTPYLNSSLAANTAVTIATFPLGIFWIFDLSQASMGTFQSNSVSTLTDRGSDAAVQIAGADPGASSSKIWVSLSAGTLQIYNRYAAAHFIVVMGFGMN
jgi:hypothetical protein